MLELKIQKDFDSQAITLDPHYVGDNESGWKIEGDIHEDYFEWVNDFVAAHDKYGRVYGDFEETVYFETVEAMQHFMSHHAPDIWDYHDI